MRGLTDAKQAQLAASLAEPFEQAPARHQVGHDQRHQHQQQPRPDGGTNGASEPGSGDPSAHGSDRSFELNPQRFDPDSGAFPDPDPQLGTPRGPVKHDSASEVSRGELEQHVDSTLQGSLRAAL